MIFTFPYSSDLHDVHHQEGRLPWVVTHIYQQISDDDMAVYQYACVSLLYMFQALVSHYNVMFTDNFMV